METLPALDPDPLRSGERLCLVSEAFEINMSMFILRGALYHTQGCEKHADWLLVRMVGKAVRFPKISLQTRMTSAN